MDEDIDMRALRRVATGALAVIAAAAGAAIALLQASDSGRQAAPLDEPQHWAARPLLETAPRDALRDYLADKRALLEDYGWIDPAAGIARLPIDQAMRALSAMARSGPAAGPVQDADEAGAAPQSGVRQP